MTPLLDTALAGRPSPEPLDDGFTLDFPGMTPGSDYTVKLVLADVRTRDHRDTLFSVDANGHTALRHGAIVNSVDPGDNLARTSFIAAADDGGAIHLTFSSAFERRQIRGIQILHGRHTPPAAPAHVRAVVGVGKIEVRWDPVQNAASYVVRRRGGAAHHMSPVASGLTDCVYNDAMVAPDVAYSYQVIAISQMGEGEPSLAVEAVPAVGLEAQPPIVHLSEGAGGCLLAATIQPGIFGTLHFTVGGMRDGLSAIVEPAWIEVRPGDAERGPLVTSVRLTSSATTGPGIQNLAVRARIDQFAAALNLPVKIV